MFDESLDIIKNVIFDWYIAAIKSLPDFVAALVVLLIFIYSAKYLRKLVLKLLKSYSPSAAANNLIANISYVGMFSIGIMVALSFVNWDDTVNKLLAGAGIIGLGLSFAFQDIAANVFSGAVIAIRRLVKIGDIIETNGIFGKVEAVGIRSVEINNLEGQLVVIPSRQVLQNILKLYTLSGKRRVTLEVGVSYTDDLEHVKNVTLAAVENLCCMIDNESVEFFYTKFDESSINFIVRFWVNFNNQNDYLEAKSKAVMKIKKSFDENGITIPFPIRTLDINKFPNPDKQIFEIN
ncbi:MAG: mechanosensitive ion channel family protein [Candidatus Kapaibacterium sp.]|nr:mechanosensitive ion channel family protein [Candidatus Kapabacteria bacterium]